MSRCTSMIGSLAAMLTLAMTALSDEDSPKKGGAAHSSA